MVLATCGAWVSSYMSYCNWVISWRTGWCVGGWWMSPFDPPNSDPFSAPHNMVVPQWIHIRARWNVAVLVILRRSPLKTLVNRESHPVFWSLGKRQLLILPWNMVSVFRRRTGGGIHFPENHLRKGQYGHDSIFCCRIGCGPLSGCQWAPRILTFLGRDTLSTVARRGTHPSDTNIFVYVYIWIYIYIVCTYVSRNFQIGDSVTSYNLTW